MATENSGLDNEASASQRADGHSLLFDARLYAQMAQHRYPLIFTTISGAHLYGFPSPDSDYDLRGVHVLPVREVIGLETGPETIERTVVDDGLEIDLVTHDAKKFFSMMLKKNGYVLEQILSPLVLHTSPEHDELKTLALRCITKHHGHHYLGFSATQWKLFQKERVPRVKPLLYVYRVLLTGIHLMQTGTLNASLPELNEYFRLSYIPDLIAQKLHGPEKGSLKSGDIEFHEGEIKRLTAHLETSMLNSRLPEYPAVAAQLNDLLIRLRVL